MVDLIPILVQMSLLAGLMLPEIKLMDAMADHLRIKPRINVSDFSEQKVVTPDGPYKGLRLKIDRQPYLRHWFNAFDLGIYTKFIAVGPVQSGKTLAILIPVIHSLFELNESVVFGVPTRDIWSEKWRIDIEPLVAASEEFDSMLPDKGPGSRGSANPSSVRFRNGSVLKPMTGAGRDESRSHFTTRIVAITEVDKMDKVSTASKESDPIHQLEGRTAAYGSRRVIIMECSPTDTNGRIWLEYLAGTQSRIALRCPICGGLSVYDRKFFKGWERATSVAEAAKLGRFHCPVCDEAWTEEQRHKANLDSELIHKGQQIVDNEIVGDAEPTTAFGLHWTAVNNMFYSPSELAKEEYKAATGLNELDESSEKSTAQQYWGIPYDPPKSEYKITKISNIILRMPKEEHRLVKGVVPLDYEALGLGCDQGKHWLHWVLIARLTDGTYHICDYDTFQVHSDKLPEEEAVRMAILEFHESVVLKGWTTLDGRTVYPHITGYDSGDNATKSVYPAVEKIADESVIAIKGFGYDQLPGGIYRPAGDARKQKIGLSDAYWQIVDVGEVDGQKFDVWRGDIDADQYKKWINQGLNLKMNTPGSLSLFYKKNARDHMAFAKHLNSEQLESEFVPGRGWVEKFVTKYYQNHYLDATAYAWFVSDVAMKVGQLEEEEQETEPEITVHDFKGAQRL